MNVKLRLKEFISNKSRSFEYQPLRKEIKPDYENQTAGTETKGGILSCCCQRRNERTKNILLNVSGIAKPHSLLAILGASGSGKTTLLNCLTNRNLGSLKAEGCILVNGENIGEDLYEISGYIQQEDTFIGNLTVKEHMWFYMSLKKCENTAIGISGSKKGISGGERKRLSFAEKLLTKPSIIFCDEPTSGLDSFTARTVIQSLKLLADKGHTILTTLHQPSSDLFAMFDQIMFMAEGRVAFLGPKNDATKFLSGLGYQCPVNYNISDFFINTLAIIPGQEKEGKETIKKICNSFDESSYAKTIKYQIQEQMNVGNNIKIIEIQQLSKIISNGQSFPDIFRIFEDVSCIRYGYQILLISQWKNVQHLGFHRPLLRDFDIINNFCININLCRFKD
ncbi:hypothetical protein LSH36_566g01084 [Paralvinella palmiformis]|uniref:ABC transporter domain-containing protein n=1 Tax=Paralvinella palmiformis TaxID=53620 RepID=A0AAD9J7M2_9ANNE|nr:hypothetical protein LSH36_566g01084 [Paralvinella palmiformis]